jgi:hypothetical protein
MNSRSAQRQIGPPEGELVSPLTDLDNGRCRGFAQAKRSWRKPLSVLVAETLAYERALLKRLSPGLWAPPIIEDYERNQAIFFELQRRIGEQIASLEKFATVDWSECK